MTNGSTCASLDSFHTVPYMRYRQLGRNFWLQLSNDKTGRPHSGFLLVTGFYGASRGCLGERKFSSTQLYLRLARGKGEMFNARLFVVSTILTCLLSLEWLAYRCYTLSAHILSQNLRNTGFHEAPQLIVEASKTNT